MPSHRATIPFATAASALLAITLSAGPANAEPGGGGMGHGKHGGGEGHSAAMGHGGQEGEGHGGKGGGGHGKHGDVPGMVEQVCREGGGMPPKYCAPSFKVMSSVPGLQIADAGPVGDRVLWVKLGDLGAQQGAPFPRSVVIVGGGGELAGATVVNGGWQQQTTVRLALEGSDTLYGTRSIHLHAFPLTGP